MSPSPGVDGRGARLRLGSRVYLPTIVTGGTVYTVLCTVCYTTGKHNR